ncbi:MAG: MBL fold metallo-hydrolase [Parvularculaceae bacterium]|nr:MBL fold metallo-hydrolase [Parvularculaceae bacterium]
MSDVSVTVLGCGSSGGVPRPGGSDGTGDWGQCDPHEPKNRRMRCSALVERRGASGVTRVLVDTSPDLRTQLLAAKCPALDAVLYTHDHADQTHGIDDLRPLVIAQRRRVPVYMDASTRAGLMTRFRYCFEQAPGSLYPPILEAREMPPPGVAFAVEGAGGAIPIVAFAQDHGGLTSLGFRFGAIAYSSDVVGLPEESFRLLEGADTWIVDALQMKPHKTHAHLDLALSWIARVKPRRAILTNLHVSMDYDTLRRTLPANVEPAYDGLVVTT